MRDPLRKVEGSGSGGEHCPFGGCDWLQHARQHVVEWRLEWQHYTEWRILRFEPWVHVFVEEQS